MTKRQKKLAGMLRVEFGIDEERAKVVSKRILTALKPVAKELQTNADPGDDTDPNAPPTKPGH